MIILDVLPAPILGVVIALLLLIYRASRPLISMLGADPAAPGAFEDIKRHPLFHANAELVRDAIDRAVASSPARVRAVVLILAANDDIASASAEQLTKLTGTLHASQVAFGIAHLYGPAVQMAQRSGLLAKIGPDRIFPTTATAVAWAASHSAAPQATGLGRAGPPSQPAEEEWWVRPSHKRRTQTAATALAADRATDRAG